VTGGLALADVVGFDLPAVAPGQRLGLRWPSAWGSDAAADLRAGVENPEETVSWSVSSLTSVSERL
jgi:hypothetical protein